MQLQFLLVACFLGTILANPIREETCEKENERRNECIKKYAHNVPKWWENSFLEKLYPLQVWKDCVGKAECYHVKKLNDLSEVMYNGFVYLHKNLRTCLGNGTIEKFSESCHTSGQAKRPCDDRSEFDCMINEMEKDEICNSEDVKAFDALVPSLIRSRILDDEVHGDRRCKDTMVGYKKTETSKSVLLSSFLHIIRTIFA